MDFIFRIFQPQVQHRQQQKRLEKDPVMWEVDGAGEGIVPGRKEIRFAFELLCGFREKKTHCFPLMQSRENVSDLERALKLSLPPPPALSIELNSLT